ncbi:MAG: tRNA guanosine(34) transglycosylase Tgt [Candidatus Moranbacteria bacterium CG23_combo_of_CG06-09_8_20_14_all_35_22]|nr:MAG: tRNA guanosine(34) transglycosylase Tgt [Candidatus Moranbacteria bacterium CG23_combo_of_CG06-09_8_20_14_all_35_22]
MFEIILKNPNSRCGIIRTKNREIKTPFFMPDATRGFVRSIDNGILEKEIDLEAILINTYHLFLNPGMEIIKKAGGAHKFMNWSRPLLSDSGGYQIFSLIHKNSRLGKITEDEVIFKSPTDGTKHILTPEKAIQIQFDLGVDMMVCLDDPSPNDYPKEKIAQAVSRTIRWANRCKKEYEKQIKVRKISEKNRPLIFGVIQGGQYLDLRKHCTQELVKIGFDGYGFGARHIDSKGNFMEEVVRETASFIPKNALRFALGVGTPEDIVKCFSYGWDMFDCVIPTREGRHGRLFLRKEKNVIASEAKQSRNISTNSFANIQDDKSFYETININNGKYKDDFSRVDEHCDCVLCKNHTKAYLHHLFASKEMLGMRLSAIHNLKFYADLLGALRNSVN